MPTEEGISVCVSVLAEDGAALPTKGPRWLVGDEPTLLTVLFRRVGPTTVACTAVSSVESSREAALLCPLRDFGLLGEASRDDAREYVDPKLTLNRIASSMYVLLEGFYGIDYGSTRKDEDPKSEKHEGNRVLDALCQAWIDQRLVEQEASPLTFEGARLEPYTKDGDVSSSTKEER